MKLYSLLKNINCRVLGNMIVEISGLYHKDTEVKENGLFFCLRGTRVDGNEFVFSAVKNGAVAIVVEQEIQNLAGVTQVVVKNAREAMSLIASKFYGTPASKLKIVGVTGTNGKTTITNMIANVLKFAGKSVAVVGTNGVFFKGKRYDTGMTTPDPIELQKYFASFVKNRIEYVCMEVSAHASFLKKVEGIMFSQMVFTNLTEDHLDFFKTMQNYFDAKAKLFQQNHTMFAVINADDAYGKTLSSCIKIPFATYAIDETASLTASKINLSQNGQTFVTNNGVLIEMCMVGKFNVSNALAAICVLRKLGISDDLISQAFKQMSPVEGRFNSFFIDDKLVVVDYAHTPDGLKNVLQCCRSLAGINKVISVFGCGGNREVEKRSIMGEISSKLADFTIITSDNPRFESRLSIAKDIEKGMKNSAYKIELDRVTAIADAIGMAGDGDVVLVAGKGAEDYIDENGTKIPYSDLKEVEKYRR